MEAWREELYHGLFSNIKRAWKQHKYVRKEGTRYIYPEDLKNENSIKGKTYANTGQEASDRIKLLDSKYNKKPGVDTYWGHKARNALKDVTHVIKTVNEQTHGASDNKAHASQYNEKSKTSERNTVSLQYKNGKQWFDSMTLENKHAFINSPVSDIRYGAEHEQIYTYNYGYFHQAYNSGKAFLDKLFKKKG